LLAHTLINSVYSPFESNSSVKKATTSKKADPLITTCQIKHTVLLLFLTASVSQSTPLKQAWEEVEYVNYTGAAAFFEQEIRRDPDSAEALFGLALCLHYCQPNTADDKTSAEAHYLELISQTEGSPSQWRQLAMLNLAQLYDQVDYTSDTPQPAKAIELYSRILDEFPDSPIATQAILYRSTLEIADMNPQSASKAVRQLRLWAEQHPNDPDLYNLWCLIAQASLHPLNRPDETIAAYRKAEQAGLPPNSRKDIFFWRLANLAETSGQIELAIHYYREIAENLQHTNFAYEASLRLAALESRKEVQP
jgi:tetratricopeptide (TPR) repeat protein